MNQEIKFKKSDIKASHVVELRNGEIRIAMNVGRAGTVVLINALGEWNYLSNWDQNFYCVGEKMAAHYHKHCCEAAKGKDIMNIYGWVDHVCDYPTSVFISKENRPLLWTRTPPKKMTVSEISEALGYPVEVVPEEE